MKLGGRIFLELAVRYGAIQLEPTELKSGLVSPYFFNLAHLSTGNGLNYVGGAMARLIEEQKLPCETIYGPPYKGLLLAPIVARELSLIRGRDIHWASHRKEIKPHGEGGALLGRINGLTVIVDDVFSSGSSKAEALNRILEHGGQPTAVLVGLDREEPLDDESEIASLTFARTSGIPVCALATFSDLLEFVQESHTENYEALLQYRKLYSPVT